MPTSYTTGVRVSSASYTVPSPVSTDYNQTRLGGAFLVDVLGRYITDISGRRIVVLRPGGFPLNNTTYTVRTPI